MNKDQELDAIIESEEMRFWAGMITKTQMKRNIKRLEKQYKDAKNSND